MALNRSHSRNIYFGQRLKELRESFNLTQSEFALSIGLEKDNAAQTVSNWETSRREPNFNMLCKIADFFGVTTDYMLGRSSSFKDSKEILVLRMDELDEKQKSTLMNILELVMKPK